MMTSICLFILYSIFAFAHPLDNLNQNEIKLAQMEAQKSLGDKTSIAFAFVRPVEPKKSWWKEEKEEFRQAHMMVWETKKGLMYEMIFDFIQKKLILNRPIPNMTPPILVHEYGQAADIVRKNEKWLEAIKKRGYKAEELHLDTWAPGLLRPQEMKKGTRPLRVLTYKKLSGQNFYSRPIEGLVATVDMASEKMISLWDENPSPMPAPIKELEVKTSENAFKPLVTKMPEGVSFKEEGQEVFWGPWKLRWSMDPMHGLVLHRLHFLDNGKWRSVMHKMALSEMLVPYGDPSKAWSFRNAFDVGEYGLGKTLHPLIKGLDVPHYSVIKEVPIAQDDGKEPVNMPVVAIYERDGGLFWKHRPFDTGLETGERHRQLVLTFMTTIGNYDYGINYILHRDGIIEVDAQLTGILLAQGSKLKDNPCKQSCKLLVEPHVIAPPHQHFFNFRMDFDLDGNDGHYVAKTEVTSVPKGKNNPDGNAFVKNTYVLKNEKTAVGNLDIKLARHFKIYNPNSTNQLGHPRSYFLMAGETAVPYLHPENQIRTRARFIENHAWFTVFREGEETAAAIFPTGAPANQGLPQYVSNNESLESKDIVFWYTFGVTHFPRPEEWPVMNVHHAGFKLVPLNFFSQNPVL